MTGSVSGVGMAASSFGVSIAAGFPAPRPPFE